MLTSWLLFFKIYSYIMSISGVLGLKEMGFGLVVVWFVCVGVWGFLFSWFWFFYWPLFTEKNPQVFEAIAALHSV